MPKPMLTIAALDHFTRFDDPAALRGPLLDQCTAHGVKGSLLLAREGVNGTIAGPRAGIDAVLGHLRALPGCAALEHKESHAEAMPFGRIKVKLKREIVTMGQPDVDPTARVGSYLSPAEWNALIASEDVALIDTRNDYEVAIGTFKGAIDPDIRTFRDFPRWWEENRAKFQGKRIAMFCTGGIRCEKASSYMLSEGFDEVYHLKGGILKYLEQVPEVQSLWQGECFVFDERVGVGPDLRETGSIICFNCQMPLTIEDQQRPDYVYEQTCLHCVNGKPKGRGNTAQRGA